MICIIIWLKIIKKTIYEIPNTHASMLNVITIDCAGDVGYSIVKLNLNY